MTNSSTVFFLGTGATAGSGIKKNEYSLPTDSDFFCSTIVKKQLDNYPALKKFREPKESNDLMKTNSLCKTWEYIFNYRGLSRAKLKIDERISSKINDLRNYSYTNWIGNQKDHYKYQFDIMDNEKNNFLPKEQKSEGYYFGELAIWDLRVLLKQVYQEYEKNEEFYTKFYNKIKHRKPIFVNLNYDTTFEDCFEKKNKLEIIKPHGSLKWITENNFSLNKNDWCTPNWKDSKPKKNIELNDLGYRKTEDKDCFNFCQPLIVPSVHIKEEVVGNSSMQGLQHEILKEEWNKLVGALRNSNHWVFIGYSFASGDEHLIFLLKQLYNDNKQIHCCIYGSDTTPVKNLAEILHNDNKPFSFCIHQIKKGEKLDTFHLCKSLKK